MGINFESKATYNDKYINTKIKTYKDSITTNIYDETGFKEVPEEEVPYNIQILFFMHMKSITHKHFQKNANI